MNIAGSYKYKLVLRYPASWWGNMWREALPSGNGMIGAAVYGAIKDETVLINHGELWHWGHKDSFTVRKRHSAETRRLMDEGSLRRQAGFLQTP